MLTRFFWLGGIFLTALLSLQAAGPLTKGPTSFSAAEVAQGFRNGHLLVKVKEGASEAALNALSKRLGLRVHRTFAHLRGEQVLEFSNRRPLPVILRELRASGLYEHVEPEHILHARLASNDPDFKLQWSLNNTAQSGGVAGADIKALAGWSINTSAANIIVAIIDSGINLTHQDLVGNLWTNTAMNQDGYVNDLHGINATFPSYEPGNGDPTDDFFHGSMVAGIIGASGNNGIGITGIAWNTQLMALKFISSDGFGSGEGELACIDYAIAHHVSIVNGSFGSDTYSSVEYDAFQQAGEAGIIFVVAAGNDGENSDRGYDYPAGYMLDNIVAVAATDESDNLASYSNFGSGLVELAAPGSDIVSTGNGPTDAYLKASGTSFASPHVAGVLALLKARFSSDTNRQLINRLLRAVDPIPALAGKVQTGGRLNLQAAMSSTTNRPFNDDFANRPMLAGDFVQARADNVGATLQTGEVSSIGEVSVGGSLWWTWTAPSTATYHFDTVGSTYATAIAIYTGGVLPQLTTVAFNTDPGVGASSLSLNVTVGTVYQIRIAGQNGQTGLTALRIATSPGNDSLANAQSIPTGLFSLKSSTLYASSGPEDALYPAAAKGHSVWYSWTAPASSANSHYELAAYSTSLNMIAAVYKQGTSGLTLVASNDDVSAKDGDSVVSFNADPGQTYFFQVDNSDIDGGNFTLTLTQSVWQFGDGAGISSSSAVDAAGNIYISDNNGNVTSLARDGTQRWTFLTGGEIDSSSPTLSLDATVYVGSSDTFFYALDANTGLLKWKFAATTPISSTAALGPNGDIYFRDDLNLYCLTSTGAKVWSYPLSGGTGSSPAIGTDGTIYVGATKGNFYAILPSGATKWSFVASEAIEGSPAIGADGSIYFASVDGNVYSFDAAGNERWMRTPQAFDQFTTSPIIASDGNIIFAGGGGNIYTLSPSGAPVGTVTIPAGIAAVTPALADDGTLYVSGDDFNLYAVTSTQSNSSLFTTSKVFASAASYIFSSPTVADGRLYFGSLDGRLYAFDLGHLAAMSAWPMSGQNAQHTGNMLGNQLVIGTVPQAKTFIKGGPLALSVQAVGAGPVSYQWYQNGNAISGATDFTYTLASASSTDAGSYTVTVVGPANTVTSSPVLVTVIDFSSTPGASRLINISTRSLVQTGSNITIAGFVITGSQPKNVLIRANGPALLPLGITNYLKDPTLALFSGSTITYQNTGWNSDATIAATALRVGALAWTAGSADSALLVNLKPGQYTAQVSGNSGDSGVALIEVYDADASSVDSKLVNISTRSLIGTGPNIQIAGFVITGPDPKTVLIRANGPSLGTQGVSAILPDPDLKLFQGSSMINENQGWASDRTVSLAASQVGAFFWDAGSADAALVVTLSPGIYTAQVSGLSGDSGTGLIEVYDVH